MASFKKNCYHHLIILTILLFIITENIYSLSSRKSSRRIKYSKKSKQSKLSIEEELSKLNEFSADYQRIKFLLPSKQCKISNPTVFFEKQYFKYKQTVNKNELNHIRTKTIKISEKPKFITAFIPWENGNMAQVFREANVNVTRDKNSQFVNFYWETHKKGDFFYYYLDNYQIYAKDASAIFFYGKSILVQKYKIFQNRFPEYYDFLPESYDYPRERKIIYNKFKDYKLDINDLWITKPIRLSGGRGINFFTSYKDLGGYHLVLSKYISNPLLLNSKKFDLRLYVLVSSMNPLKIYLHNEGLVRITTEDYSVNEKSLKKKNVHLTNVSLNERYKKYKTGTFDSTKGNLWSVTTLKKVLRKYGINWNSIWNKIKEIIIKVIAMYVEDQIKYEKKNNIEYKHFNFWGFDILIDENYTPYLLETNTTPGLRPTAKWEIDFNKEIIRDFLNIIGIQSFDRNDESIYKKIKTVQEKVDESICEMTRPTGAFERIFPKLDNIKYYSRFLYKTRENKRLWEEMRRLKIE